MLRKPVLIYALAVCLLALLDGNNGIRWGLNPNPNFLAGLTQVVNATVNVSSKTPTTNTTYFWDLLPPIAKNILLNQTAVQAVYNVTNKILVDSYLYLSWVQIPIEAQNILYTQKLNTTSYMTMTFGNLSLANATDPRYNMTIESFLSPQGRRLLQNATALFNPLEYNTSIDVMKLPLLLNKISSFYTSYTPQPGMGWDRVFKDLPAFTRPVTQHIDINRYFQYVFAPSAMLMPFPDITRRLFASLIGLFDTIVYAPADFNYWLL